MCLMFWLWISCLKSGGPMNGGSGVPHQDPIPFPLLSCASSLWGLH